MPILTTEQAYRISRAHEDAKIHMSSYAKHLFNSIVTVAMTANLYDKFYKLVYNGEEPTFCLMTLKRYEAWNNNAIETSKVLEIHDVLDKVQSECGEYVHVSWDWDDNSDIINVFLTFIPPKHNSPEDEVEERRHDRATSW